MGRLRAVYHPAGGHADVLVVAGADGGAISFAFSPRISAEQARICCGIEELHAAQLKQLQDEKGGASDIVEQNLQHRKFFETVLGLSDASQAVPGGE